MEFYFAPLEGVTGYLYREAHHRFFEGMDKYYIPFFAPKENSRFSQKEKNEVSEKYNAKTKTIPQLLTNRTEPFIRTAKELKEMGYEEINLNLGCPSGTVVSKNKGAGFLAIPEELDFFLYEIYSNLDMKISIKSRLGMEDSDEFWKLLEIYEKYPVSELILHPRVREDYYKKPLHMDVFAKVVENTKLSICYNGDIFTKKDYDVFVEKFPSVDKIMLGRGMISNPGLARQLQGGKAISFDEFQKFYQELFAVHQENLYGDKTLMFHMKELMSYMVCMFADYKKPWKKICKAQTLPKYEAAVEELFTQHAFLPEGAYIPPHLR